MSEKQTADAVNDYVLNDNILDKQQYRVSIKSFPDYKHYKLHVAPQLEEFQP